MHIINEDKLLEVFIECDDFCKSFDDNIKCLLAPNIKQRQVRKPGLSTSEIMTILIFYHLSGMKCFKYYYERVVVYHLNSHFPHLTSYNRFIELIPRHLLYLFAFLNLKRTGQEMGIAYVDSKKLTVCHNKRIHNHKVFEGLAKRGHCSVGWFFGFKLFLIINPFGEILRCLITPANVADNDVKIWKKLFKNLQGKVFGDKGFISSKGSEALLDQGLHLITKLRSNMKNRLITLQDKWLLSKRGVIESVYDILSAICDIDHSRHRSPANAFTHLFAGLVAYTFLDRIPSIFRKKLVPSY